MDMEACYQVLIFMDEFSTRKIQKAIYKRSSSVVSPVPFTWLSSRLVVCLIETDHLIP